MLAHNLQNCIKRKDFCKIHFTNASFTNIFWEVFIYRKNCNEFYFRLEFSLRGFILHNFIHLNRKILWRFLIK